MARKTNRQLSSELHARYKKLQREHRALRNDMNYNTRQYFMDHWEGDAKPHEERVTLPTCTNAVDMAHAVLMQQKRSFHVVPTRPIYEAQAISSELEKWLHGVFYVNEVRSGEDRVGLALWNALVKKLGWLRYRWDDDLVGEQQMAEMPMPIAPGIEGRPQTAPVMQPVQMLVCDECPIVIESIPPENMFVKWGGRHGILYLFYAARRKLEEIEAEYGRIRMDPWRGMDWEERADVEVEFLEYWGYQNGKLMTATMIDNRFLPERKLREAVGYDSMPYVPLFCYRTAAEDPEKQARGMLDAMTELVHHQERNLTKLNMALKMYSIMPLVVNEGQTGQAIDVDLTLGNIITLKRGQTVSFPQWPGTPPDFKWALSLLEDKVQESGFPSVSFGQGPASLSGYAITQYNEGARARLGLPRQNLALALTKVAQGIIGLCANMAPNVGLPVWGRHKNQQFYSVLTGSMMRGHIIEVDISSDLPGDMVRNATIGGQLKASGSVSDRYILEKWLGIEDVEGEMTQKHREAVMRNPMVVLDAIARSMAEDDDPMARAALAQLQQALAKLEAPPPPQTPMLAAGGGPPPPRPQGVPAPVMPPIAQGQVLRQDVGLPPTNQEILGV